MSSSVSGRVMPSRSVQVPPSSSVPIWAAIASASSGARWRRSSCATGSRRRPVPLRAGRVDAQVLAALDRLQAAVVGGAGDEAAHLGVHAPAAVEEDAAPGADGVVVPEHVLEHGGAGAVRVGALADVRQLLRVAEQDDVPRPLRDGDRVGQRHLARLVHEQAVDALALLLARPVPRGAGHEVRARRRWAAPAMT
jgi:hypothetical protein